MKPSEALSQHREAVLNLATAMGQLRVFGSVLHGCDTETSDLDLLIDAPRGTTLLDLAHLQDALETLLGVPVDLLTAGDLPAHIRERVLQEAQQL